MNVVGLVMVVLVVGLVSATFVGAEPGQVGFLDVPTFGHRDCSGITGALECAVGYVGDGLGVVWGVVRFVFSVLTFNVPGAPSVVRLVVGTFFGISGLWIGASFLRGFKT